MAQVLIRNLDDAVVETYRRRAAEKGRSLEGELRETLLAGARLSGAERGEIIRRTLAHNARLINRDVPQTPGSVLVIEGRQEADC